MNHHKILGYIFIIMVFAAAVSLVYYQQTLREIPKEYFNRVHASDLKKYQDQTNHYQIFYDKDYELKSEGNTVTVSIPQSLYDKTNFNQASVTIDSSPVLRKLTENSCLGFDGQVRRAKIITIKKIDFSVRQTSEAAAGTRYDSSTYRTFHNGQCYEIALVAGISNIANYTKGAVSEVSAIDVWNRLNSVLLTFQFNN